MSSIEERSEDLNPRGKDVDEKIRRLLDPSVPDDDTMSQKTSDILKIKQVDVKVPIADAIPAVLEPTAPELALPPSKGKKIIVPIVHDSKDDITPTQLPEAEEPEDKPVTKIDITHHDDTNEELAEKLDAAIADLDQEPEEAEVAETAEPTEDEAPLPASAVIEDTATEKAVKDIVTSEGDELLEIEDALRGSETETPKTQKHFSLKALLLNKRAAKAYTALLVVGLIAAVGYPASRYAVLNLAGIRSASSLTVLDASTQQPLKNVTISLAGATAKTDEKGKVSLQKLKLGKTVLKIERIAFASIEKPLTVGWGSNPLGSFSLTPTGAQYRFEVSDVLSGKAIAAAEAETAEATASSDEKGIILLTLPKTDETEITVVIKAANYRQETIKLNVSSKETIKLQLAPARKHAFISKRTGKFDIYTVFADGKDEKLLLAGSGNEKDDLTLLPHPNQELVAYVSTRAGKHNKDGFLLSDLILLDTKTGRTTPITSAERVQLVGWAEDRLVFVTIVSGASAASANRNRLLSYNMADTKTTELATSNYFNDLLYARGQVYFAPSSAYAGGTPAQFYQVKADGSGQKSLFNQEVWNILRTSYNSLALSVGQQWYEYVLGGTQAKKLETAPISKVSRVYVDSPDAKNSAWVDQRDGKGTLLIYDVATGKDTVITARTGLGLPLVWLDNKTLVHRIDSKDELADYAVSLSGGEPRKIRDVTKTGGLDNWYYY